MKVKQNYLKNKKSKSDKHCIFALKKNKLLFVWSSGSEVTSATSAILILNNAGDYNYEE